MLGERVAGEERGRVFNVARNVYQLSRFVIHAGHTHAGFSAPNECDVSKPRLTNFVAKSKVIHRFCHEVVVKTKERTLIETSSNDRIKSVIVDI